MAEESGTNRYIEDANENDLEQIQKLQILRTLLKYFKDVQCEYPLSALLEYFSEEYPKDILLQGILQLADEEYVIIKSSKVAEQGNKESVKQLINEEEYDSILISLQEREGGILLRNFVDARISMLEMRTQTSEIVCKISDCEARLEHYEQDYQSITKNVSAVQECYENFQKDKDDFTQKYDEAQSNFETRFKEEQETFKDSVLKNVEEKAEEKVSDKIEEELAQSGRIGSAVQDTQKNIIQFMAIFVAIFSLVSVNITNAGKWCYAELFRVNVIMTASMFTLVALTFVFTTNDTVRIKRLLIVVGVIWIALAVSAGVSMCSGSTYISPEYERMKIKHGG